MCILFQDTYFEKTEILLEIWVVQFETPRQLQCHLTLHQGTAVLKSLPVRPKSNEVKQTWCVWAWHVIIRNVSNYPPKWWFLIGISSSRGSFSGSMLIFWGVCRKYVENMSKCRNAWEMTWDELILQECQHIQDGGRNMYHLKKIAGMFNLLSTLRLLWNQHEPTAPLPRLSFDHRDTGGSPLSSRGWAHQTEDNSLGQVSVKDRLRSLILKVSKIKTSSHNPNISQRLQKTTQTSWRKPMAFCIFQKPKVPMRRRARLVSSTMSIPRSVWASTLIIINLPVLNELHRIY